MPNQVIHREQPMTPAIIEQTVYVSFSDVVTIPHEKDIVERAVENAAAGFWEGRLDTLTAVIIPIFTGYLVQLVHIVWNYDDRRGTEEQRENFVA